MAEYFTGDDWTIPVTLKKNGSVFDVSGGTVTAAVVKLNGDTPTVLIDDTVQSEVATGADWTNGIVIVEFAKANTDISTTGDHWLEVQVEKAGKTETWPRARIKINQGYVT
jgi:hypothetical protein